MAAVCSSPDKIHRRNVLLAYASTWFGCFTDVMIDSSAIIIIYLNLLNAANSVIMFSTAISGLAAIPLLIPASPLVNRFGAKKVVTASCILSICGFLTIASAAFVPSCASIISLAGIIIYSASRPLWSTSWYPILADILRPEERGSFFGKMRFSYNIISGSVFYVVGLLMGKTPPAWLLQIVIAAAGLLVIGRHFCIANLKLTEEKTVSFDLKKSFNISIKNAPLVGFSVYSCFLSLAYTAIIPLALIYMKKGLNLNADTVQTISTAGIAGSIIAFVIYGKIQKKFGMRNTQLAVHLMTVLIPMGFILCRANTPFLTAALGVLLFLAYCNHALFTCCFSHECLSLSRPGNAAMASAFANTYNNIGIAVGRTVNSLLLGHGILNSSWSWNGFVMNEFQSLFLFCAVGALFCGLLLFILPSVIPQHDDYYKP